MLETREERVRLLKGGIPGNKIEELYILSNNLKILNQTVLFVALIKTGSVTDFAETSMM